MFVILNSTRPIQSTPSGVEPVLSCSHNCLTPEVYEEESIPSYNHASIHSYFSSFLNMFAILKT